MARAVSETPRPGPTTTVVPVFPGTVAPPPPGQVLGGGSIESSSSRPKMPGDVPRFVEESHGQLAGWLGASWDPLTIDARPDLPDYRVGDFQLQEGLTAERLTGRKSLLGE